jgi:hypothetical protein
LNRTINTRRKKSEISNGENIQKVDKADKKKDSNPTKSVLLSPNSELDHIKKFTYLKRNTKKISTKKVDWRHVTSKIESFRSN